MTLKKKSQPSPSKSTDDGPEDTSETACSEQSNRETAGDETLRANSSMTENVLLDETEQSSCKNGDESNATRGWQQNHETRLVIDADTTDGVTNESGQETSPSSSPPPSTIQSHTDTALFNLPVENLQAAVLRRILSQQPAHQAQAQSQRNIPPSNEQLLDQQNSLLAHPFMAVPGIPLAIIPPVPPSLLALHPTLMDALQLSHNQFPNVHLFPQSPTILFGQPQLASLTQNVSAHVSQAQITAAQIQLASLLASAVGQANNSPYMPPSPTLAAHMLSSLTASSSNLNIARQAEYPTQLNQNIDHSNRVEQLVALLLSQQQLDPTNTTSRPGPTPPFTNQRRLQLQQLNAGPEPTTSRTTHFATPADSTVFPQFFHSVSNLLVDNAMSHQRHGSLQVPPSILQLGTRAAAPASAAGSNFLNLFSNQLAHNQTPDHILHTDQESLSESALIGSSHSKEKRWMIRYEELKQFQKVSTILYTHVRECDFIRGLHTKTSSSHSALLHPRALIKKEIWSLPGSSRIRRKSQAFMVGDEPTGPVPNAQKRKAELVVRRPSGVTRSPWI